MENIDIKKVIKSRGKKLVDVANMLGVTQSALTQQIQANSFTLARLQKIADFLGCSVVELLKTDEEITICPHCGRAINIKNIVS